MAPKQKIVALEYEHWKPRTAGSRPFNNVTEQLLGNIVGLLQELRDAVKGDAPTPTSQPLIEVTREDERGQQEVLKRVELPATPVVDVGNATDEAGYAFTLYEPPGGNGWGTVLMVCKGSQGPGFEAWGKAMAAQGLSVRRYLIEAAAAQLAPSAESEAAVGDDVIDFTLFRYKGHDAAQVMQQARGAYSVVSKVLKAIWRKPLAVCVWGHSEHWYRAIAKAAHDAGVPTLHWEGAMFPRLSNLEHGRACDPGHAVVNCGGQYYEGAEDIEALWGELCDQPLSDAQQARVDQYIAAWCSAKASKYGQPPEKQDVDTEGKRVLFVPLQIDGDASLYYTTGVVSTGVGLLDMLAECAPANLWTIIAKRHPHDNTSEAALNSREARHGHLHVLHEGNIHDCIQAADCVCGINSTVLLESMCYDKPVITLADSCFTGKGFTSDVRDERALARALRFDRKPLVVTEDMRGRFRRFLHMLMWEGNGGNGFLVDIDTFDAARLLGA